MKTIAYFAATVVAVLVLSLWLRRYVPPEQVTLKAGPTNPLVQMFDSVGDGPEGNTHTFPDGTSCTVQDGPAYITVAAIPVQFYRLTCHGTTGYINAQYVRRY
jgi:hypothetical protein